MEILIIVRLCCNCTYGEVGGVALNLGAGRGAMLQGHWPGAGCPCWGLEAASCSAA